MKRLLRRMGRTSAAELWDRSAQRVHTAREAIAVSGGLERWERNRLRSRLRSDDPGLRAVVVALAGRDWRSAEIALRNHLANRAPRFVIGPGHRAHVASLIRDRYPSAPQHAAARATDLLQGRYDLLGYQGLSFRTSTSELDWHFDPVHGRQAPRVFWSRVRDLDPRSGDHQIIWELNRHQHWLALGRAAWLTGDSRYAIRFRQELDSWLRANPPCIGINWASMLELAFRSISWIWVLNLFAEFGGETDQPTFVDLLVGLDRQLDQVANHLSTYFSPNTHLLGEGLALYVAGRSLPELTSSARWERIGRRILLRETRAQVHADGGHAELSTHYHRYALDFYLLALVVARRTGDPVERTLAEAVSRLAGFCRDMADDRGRLPTIGDDDGGLLFPICGRLPCEAEDSLALAAALLDRPDLAVGDLPEEALWMLGGDVAARTTGGARAAAVRRLFPDTGYAVLRSPEAHAILDVGPHGFLNGGHAHADALSFVLSLENRPLLIDPGTSTYTMDPGRRDRFRSTAMHNTVAIDGRAQSLPDGPFHWVSRARAALDLWRPLCGFVEASHDGYLPLVHRRAVLRAPNGIWLVADHVLGTGHHEAAAHWHLSPDWTLEPGDEARTAVRHGDGSRAALASTASHVRKFHGDAEGLGWCAPVYGQYEPALTLRFSTAAEAPFSVLTVLASGAQSTDLAVQQLDVAAREADGWHALGAQLTSKGSTTIVLFATPLSGAAAAQARGVRSLGHSAGPVSTDARAAVLQLSAAGTPEALIAADCSQFEWTGDGAFRLTPQPEERDLHLDMGALRRLSRPAAARPVG